MDMDMDMGTKTKTVRILALFSMSTYLIFVFGRTIAWGNIDPNTQMLLDMDGYGGVFPVFEYSYLFWVLASVVSYLGILMLTKWGRWSLIGVYVLFLITAPFSGVMVNTALERVLMTSVLLVDGMLLALLFVAWPDVTSKQRGTGTERM